MKSLVAGLVLAQFPIAWSAKTERPFHSVSHRRLRNSAAVTHHSIQSQEHPITRIESAGQEAAIQNFADILDHIHPITTEPVIKDESADDSILAAHPELQARVERVPGAKALSKAQQEMIAENLHLAKNYARGDAGPLVSLAAHAHDKEDDEDKVLLGGTLANHPELKAEVKKAEGVKHFGKIQEEMIAENLYQYDLGGRLPLPPLSPPSSQVRAAPPSEAPAMDPTRPQTNPMPNAPPAVDQAPPSRAPATQTPPMPNAPPAMHAAPPDELRADEIDEEAALNAALKSAHSNQQGAVSTQAMGSTLAKHPELTAEVKRAAPPGSDSHMLEAIAENLLASEQHTRAAPEMDTVSLASRSHDSAKMMSTLEAHPEIVPEVMEGAPRGANQAMLEAIAENVWADRVHNMQNSKGEDAN